MVTLTTEAATLAAQIAAAGAFASGIAVGLRINKQDLRDYLKPGAVAAGMVGVSALVGGGGAAVAGGVASLSALGTLGVWACNRLVAACRDRIFALAKLHDFLADGR